MKVYTTGERYRSSKRNETGMLSISIYQNEGVIYINFEKQTVLKD